jgi:hypothetical protein
MFGASFGQNKHQSPFCSTLFMLLKMLRASFWRLANIKNVQKIWDPERIEKITSASFFFSVVLPKVEELKVKDVTVPRLNVVSERARTLICHLGHITNSDIVGSQHRHYSVGAAISSSNILSDNLDREEEHEPRSSNAEEAEMNPSSGPANHSTVPQNLVNALDQVIFHGDKEA